jgi:hypothetical protein
VGGPGIAAGTARPNPGGATPHVRHIDNRQDPRRWFYDGFRCKLIQSEQDANEARMFGWLHPHTSIQAPHWKPLAWILGHGG